MIRRHEISLPVPQLRNTFLPLFVSHLFFSVLPKQIIVEWIYPFHRLYNVSLFKL